MSPAARYLWHQRLAWLLMIYVAAVGATIGPENAFGRPNVAACLSYLTTCAIVMACVKDSALCGRPIPYSWRLPMSGTWPVTVPILMWRSRRWWGLFWFAVHGFLVMAVSVVAQMTYWVVTEALL